MTRLYDICYLFIPANGGETNGTYIDVECSYLPSKIYLKLFQINIIYYFYWSIHNQWHWFGELRLWLIWRVAFMGKDGEISNRTFMYHLLYGITFSNSILLCQCEARVGPRQKLKFIGPSQSPFRWAFYPIPNPYPIRKTRTEIRTEIAKNPNG